MLRFSSKEGAEGPAYAWEVVASDRANPIRKGKAGCSRVSVKRAVSNASRSEKRF